MQSAHLVQSVFLVQRALLVISEGGRWYTYAFSIGFYSLFAMVQGLVILLQLREGMAIS